jgi:ADP-heptose:LPS heptosyltransferase
MFEEQRKNLGLAITRILSRRNAEKPMSFSNSFTNAKTAVVIIPESAELRTVVAQMIILLQNKFQGNKLTLVVSEGHRNFSNTINRSNVTTIKNDQLNFFFLPKKSEFSMLLNQKFDMLLDLNFSLVPSAAFLCRNINAPIKVGFTQEHADAYYNFQFNAAPNRNAKMRYEQLFRTLSMF